MTKRKMMKIRKVFGGVLGYSKNLVQPDFKRKMTMNYYCLTGMKRRNPHWNVKIVKRSDSLL